MTEIEMVDRVSVKLLQSMGGDETVIGSARVSTVGDASLEALTSDPGEAEGLIRFLMRNRHGTPFEHNAFSFYVDAPIVVFREFHRHRIGWSYNEMSGRYTEMRPRFYLPFEGRNMQRVEGTKTGQYRYEPNEMLRDGYVHDASQSAEYSWRIYQEALEAGVVNEVARMHLPLNLMTEMWATANARSIMAFLSLRTERPSKDDWTNALLASGLPLRDPKPGEWAANPSRPMKEIAMVADQIEEAFAKAMPITHAAWNEFGRVAP